MSDTPDDAGGETADSVPPLAVRIGITAVVALVVAFGVGVVPALTAGPSGAEPVELNNSEYAVDELAITDMEATGTIDADASGSGTVVFDRDHANGYNREDVQPMVEAFREAGYDVEFQEDDDLASALEDAVAYVVIDAGTEFDREEIAAVRNFTDDGGRLAVFGEPNRLSVSSGGFGSVQVSTERTRGDRLISEYGLTFRTSYVYNQRQNDGGFKNPVSTPVGPASDTGSDVPVYTAARVVSLNGAGEPILRLPEGSRTSADDTEGRFPVAYERGNLIAVGDTDLLRVDRYNVGDTEQFLAYVVEFLLSGDRASDLEADDADERTDRVSSDRVTTDRGASATAPVSRVR